jgi:hypothetical protein
MEISYATNLPSAATVSLFEHMEDSTCTGASEMILNSQRWTDLRSNTTLVQDTAIALRAYEGPLHPRWQRKTLIWSSLTIFAQMPWSVIRCLHGIQL